MRRKSKYERLECTDAEFEINKTIQYGNGTSFREHIKGGRTKLIVHDQVVSSTFSTNRIDLGECGKLKFTAFLGRFNKQLYKRFRTIESLYDIDIVFEGRNKQKNKEYWESLKNGQVFYNIDVKTAYWQIANNLGYLDHGLFTDLLDSKYYKQAKRLCFSFLKRENYMIYHTPNGKTKIECDMTVLNKVLSNVRKKLYCVIEEAKQGCNTIVEWDTDGVYCLAEDVDVVTKRLKAQNLLFKITFCRKIDEYTFSYGSTIKNFKKKPK